LFSHYLQTQAYKKKLGDLAAAEKSAKQYGKDSVVKGSKNKKLTYGALVQQIMDREVVKWELAPLTYTIAQINLWSDDTVSQGQHCLFLSLVRSLRCLTGGFIETWWRNRSIDQFLYPSSTASVDVTKARADWARMVAGLQVVPREFKKGERVDLGNGKSVVRNKRGDMPVAVAVLKQGEMPEVESSESEWDINDGE